MLFRPRNKIKDLAIKFKNKLTPFLGFITGFFALFTIKRLKQLAKKENQEIAELEEGQQTPKKFFKDSANVIKDFFIPNESNDHKPKALRPKSLVFYVILAILIKVGVGGLLFFTYPSPAELAAIVAERMVNMVNEDRQAAGVEPLSINSMLVSAAQAKGQDMMQRDYFAHDTPEGKRPWQWIDKNQYDYVYAGENLAIDFTTAESVQKALMASPSHRKNILNPNYKNIGIAVINGKFDGRQTILMVEFFGTQRSELSTLAKQDNQELPVPSQPAPSQITDVKIAGEEISNLPTLNSEQSLESGVNNQSVIMVAASRSAEKSITDMVIEYSNIFFVAFLIFILVSLILNIFIKIRIQHSSVIVQTIAVTALITAMVLVNFHVPEQISTHLLIL